MALPTIRFASGTAFVGVERLGIREEPGHVIVGANAVAAQDLAGPGDRLAHPGRAERLGEGRMMVPQLAFRVELRGADHKALTSRDVREHTGEQVLDELERAE
jgi:hypothetical protein